jgi:nucleotide-binding universal stress UspA family protein
MAIMSMASIGLVLPLPHRLCEHGASGSVRQGVVMAGVVVGVKRAASCAALVRWASAEAIVRGLPLLLVHAWDEPLELSVDLDPDSLPDLLCRATSYGVPGDVTAALLGRRPDVLVLGGRGGGRRTSRLTRSCVRRAACPVIVVPDAECRPAGRVVVGVRFGATSRQALRWAAAEADRRSARLAVVHAWQLHPSSAADVLLPTRAIDLQREAVEARLREWVHQVLGDTPADIEAVYGGSLDALLAAGAGADLIVLGRRAHTGVSRLVHDAIGNDLMSLAACPVAFVPCSAAAAAAAA